MAAHNYMFDEGADVHSTNICMLEVGRCHSSGL